MYLKICGSTCSSGRPLTLIRPFPRLQWATAVAVFYKRTINDIILFSFTFTYVDHFNILLLIFNTFIYHLILLTLYFYFITERFQLNVTSEVASHCPQDILDSHFAWLLDIHTCKYLITKLIFILKYEKFPIFLCRNAPFSLSDFYTWLRNVMSTKLNFAAELDDNFKILFKVFRVTSEWKEMSTFPIKFP